MDSQKLTQNNSEINLYRGVVNMKITEKLAKQLVSVLDNVIKTFTTEEGVIVECKSKDYFVYTAFGSVVIDIIEHK